ncbi:MAG: helix-turn-helix domain-containing protein [Gammaproteobacteria bacterium]|nr:helix-turn-helix domain-containing protein [Gammaproteobacteria bacterium]
MAQSKTQTDDERTQDRLAWSIQELADDLGVCRSAIYSEISRGRLKTSKIGKRRIVTRNQREDYIREIEAR